MDDTQVFGMVRRKSRDIAEDHIASLAVEMYEKGCYDVSRAIIHACGLRVVDSGLSKNEVYFITQWLRSIADNELRRIVY